MKTKAKKTSAPSLQEKRYIVQFAIIREVSVESIDDLQAEREAYAKLGQGDKWNVVALKVLEEQDKGGALQSDDPRYNWKFAREHFGAIDKSWVDG